MSKYQRITARRPSPEPYVYAGIVSTVTIHKVTRHGVVFSGRGIPPLNTAVTIILKDHKAEGLVSACSGQRGSVLFIRPVMALRVRGIN